VTDAAVPDPGLFSVAGRTAIVTGASSGLGERFARVLAGSGAQVLAVARRLQRLESLASELGGITAHAADLAVEGARRGVIDTALERFGRIDILVNNAGYGISRPAVEEPVDAFRDVLELNLVALFDLSRLAAPPMMEAGRGSIINIASMLGLVASSPIPNASYTASKGAVVNLTRELACQWARKGVRVNAIAPGFFPSEAMDDAANSPQFLDFVARNCPIPRLGEPHELDGVLLFLASDASTFCTGQVLTVDGGWTAR
jgi:NAD(P)-dependent dehydrogenase (short-subunit alcohol dehydrogenase family)